MNTTPAVIVNIQRQPGANIIAVVDRVKTLLPQLRSALPASIQVAVLTDRTTTIRASVKDVEFELMLTIALVVMVIFLFLRTMAATIIPSVAVPLSLVGTFGVMYALRLQPEQPDADGAHDLDRLRRRRRDRDDREHHALRRAGAEAARGRAQGIEQIGFTILSLTVSLIAVLIPLLFMGDIVGRLFREFAVTLSVTILVSAVVSLTLTPMMAARLLRHKKPEDQSRFYRASERAFERVIAAYGRTLEWVLGHQTATLVVAVATLAMTIVLYLVIPKGFFPVQDTGVILGISEAPQSASFDSMVDRQQALAGVILKDPAVDSLSSFIGVDGTNTTLNSGRIQINLKPLERARSLRERRHPAAAARAREDRGDHALHAAGAGHHGRRPREPHGVSVQPRGRGRRGAVRVGQDVHGSPAGTFRSSAMWRATSRTSACRRAS